MNFSFFFSSFTADILFYFTAISIFYCIRCVSVTFGRFMLLFRGQKSENNSS